MPVLKADEVYSGYGKMEVLHGVSITLDKDQIVTIIGPNGAGKSTLFKTIMGYLMPTEGKVFLNGEEITSLPPHKRVINGLGYVPQVDNVFPTLSIRENLEMGGFTEEGSTTKRRIHEIFGIFPVLKEKATDAALTLSGGQRQMVAMGRALMKSPDCLMLDEPSAGLDPKASDNIFEKIMDIHDIGTAILIIEQDAVRSLKISDKGYVLAMGENAFEDDADKILGNEQIRKTYLGG